LRENEDKGGETEGQGLT
jgi:glutathione peroxidase-family protein